MELKFSKSGICKDVSGSNRTFMELKFLFAQVYEVC